MEKRTPMDPPFEGVIGGRDLYVGARRLQSYLLRRYTARTFREPFVRLLGTIGKKQLLLYVKQRLQVLGHQYVPLLCFGSGPELSSAW